MDSLSRDAIGFVPLLWLIHIGKKYAEFIIYHLIYEHFKIKKTID